MTLRLRLITAISTLCLWTASPALAGDDPLLGLWPEVAPVDGALSVKPNCSPPPPPVTSLATETRYDLNDAHRTRIDANRSAAYEAAVAPVRQFARLVVGYANTYALSKGRDLAAAYCAGQLLYSWASASAMEDATTDVAQFNRATFLAAVASAYIQIRASNVTPPQQWAAISSWLDRLSTLSRDFYQGKRGKGNAPLNNIQFWGGLGVAMTGVALNEREKLDWGLETLELGVCAATPQGALPAELARRERALHYHAFALAPLVALSELGQRNGQASYEVCNGALAKIIAFTLGAYDDPAQIKALSGFDQLPDTMEPETEASLAWLEIYARRFPQFLWAERMQALRPFAYTNLGGKLTQLYDGQ